MEESSKIEDESSGSIENISEHDYVKWAMKNAEKVIVRKKKQKNQAKHDTLLIESVMKGGDHQLNTVSL